MHVKIETGENDSLPVGVFDRRRANHLRMRLPGSRALLRGRRAVLVDRALNDDLAAARFSGRLRGRFCGRSGSGLRRLRLLSGGSSRRICGLRSAGESRQERGSKHHCLRPGDAELHEPRPFCFFFDAGAESWRAPAGRFAARRWRAASYKTTAPAVDTLSELTPPAMGMRKR